MGFAPRLRSTCPKRPTYPTIKCLRFGTVFAVQGFFSAGLYDLSTLTLRLSVASVRFEKNARSAVIQYSRPVSLQDLNPEVLKTNCKF